MFNRGTSNGSILPGKRGQKVAITLSQDEPSVWESTLAGFSL
jgi:hypothetical protein